MTNLTYDKANKLWKEGDAVFRQIARKAFKNEVVKAKEVAGQVNMKDKADIRTMFQGALDDGFVISSIESDKELRVTKVWYSHSRKMQYELHIHFMFGKLKVYSHEYFRTNDSTTLFGYKHAPIMDYKRGAQVLESVKLFKEETIMTNYDRVPDEMAFLSGLGNVMKEETTTTNAQVNIYVDGSWSSNTPEVAGWGFAAVHPTKISKDGRNKQILKIDKGLAPADSQQIGGELKATMSAIKWAKEKGAKRVAVYYDYAGIEKWATGEWKAKKQLPQAYAQWMQKQLNTIDVQFVKVKSHTGNQYNDLADNLAKEAITKAQVSQ